MTVPVLPISVDDIELRLAELTAAITARTELEREWRRLDQNRSEADRKERESRDKQDRKERERQAERQHRIILFLLVAVLAFAGLKVGEIIGLLP